MSTDPALPSSNGVWLPLAYYTTLLNCYYGVGPAHPAARTYSPPPAPSPTSQGPRPPDGIGGEGFSFESHPPRHWQPGGFAAMKERLSKQQPSTTPPETTPPLT